MGNLPRVQSNANLSGFRLLRFVNLCKFLWDFKAFEHFMPRLEPIESDQTGSGVPTDGTISRFRSRTWCSRRRAHTNTALPSCAVVLLGHLHGVPALLARNNGSARLGTTSAMARPVRRCVTARVSCVHDLLTGGWPQTHRWMAAVKALVWFW